MEGFFKNLRLRTSAEKAKPKEEPDEIKELAKNAG